MTRKHLVPLMVLALALSFVFGATSFARDKGAAEMTLKAETGKKPVVFNHAKHQENAAPATTRTSKIRN